MGRTVASLLLVVLTGFYMVALSPMAAAKDPFEEACISAPDSETCRSKTTENPLTGTTGLLYNVSRIAAVVAGISAVIVMIVGGIRYITSGGDSQKITSAKNTIIGALVGLVIIVLAQTIITFVIKRL